MLIKTFKFLSKEHTASTASFKSFNPKRYLPRVYGVEEAKEAKEIIDDYYVKYDKNGKKLLHPGGDDHTLFPLSFPNLGNRIVERYIDVMIHKYEIPRSEWEDRIKVNILSTTDTDGNSYIIYVCMFCGLSYKAGITAKEWKTTEIEESDISDEASAIKYNVSGEITIAAPSSEDNSNISSNNGKTSVKVRIESRDRYSVLRNTYIYDYNINDESHRFYKLYLEQDYGNPNAQPTIVTVPRRGKLFLSVDEQDIKELFGDNREIVYSVRRITGITKEKYKNKIITYDNNDYLDLGAITISTGAGSTIFSGTLHVYSQDKIIDDNSSPLNDIIVYVRTFKIDEYGFRVYNPEEQDPSNPVSYQVKANEGFNIEINHDYPYIEFSFKDGEDWWGEDVNNRPVDSYFYIHQLTDQEKLLQIIERDVNMYIVNTYKYKLNIYIPHASQQMLENNSIMSDIICYYDSDEEPMFKKRIKLSRNSEVDEYPYFLITQELPIYSRICIKTIDESFTSIYYNVENPEDIDETDGIITLKSLNKGKTNNIELYPITSYNIGIQKFYAGTSRLTYIDTYNHEKVVIIPNQFEGAPLNNLINGENRIGLDTIETEQIFKFVFPEEKISPMPGTPIFVNSMDGNDNIDSNYEVGINDYKRIYKINGKSYKGHFAIDNNCNENISDLTYSDIIPNYYISFNNIVNNQTTYKPIDKNIKVFGVYAICIDGINDDFREVMGDNIASATVDLNSVIPPCAYPFPNGVEKHQAKYKLYNISYYINCFVNQNLDEVKRFLKEVTGNDYNTVTENDILDLSNGRTNNFILNVPYNKAFYIKYPHNDEDHIYENLLFRCKPTEQSAVIDFGISLTENSLIDNSQINLNNVINN